MHSRTLPRFFAILALATLLSLLPSHAATPPPPPTEPAPVANARPDLFDVSLGFDYIRIPDGLAKNLYGFDVSAFANITNWFALGGEFMVGAGSSTERVGFLSAKIDEGRVAYVFGPRVTVWQNPEFRFYLEALAGGGYGRIDATFFGFKRTVSADGFAAAMGAGMDWRFARHWSWRIVEADYLPIQFNGQWQDHWRVASALVYSFGRR